MLRLLVFFIMHHVAWRRLCEVGFALDLALGKSCGCGRLESIWFGAIARRCHDPLPLAVFVVITWWMLLISLHEAHYGGRCLLEMGITMVDDATIFGFSSGQGGWIEAKGGSRALIWVTELQLLVYDYRGSRHGLASEALTTFVFDQYFSFPCFEKDTQQAIRCIGMGGVYRDRGLDRACCCYERVCYTKYQRQERDPWR